MYNKATPKRSKSLGGGGIGFFARFARKKRNRTHHRHAPLLTTA